MNYVRAFLNWAKGNLAIVVAACVALAAIVGLLIVQSGGKKFVADVKNGEKEIRQIKGLMQTPMVYPAENPNDPPQTLRGAVNALAIEDLKQVNDTLDSEAQRINDLTLKTNQRGHLPMLDGLFPEEKDALTPFNARFAYRESFSDMLKPNSPNVQLPRLNAGMPPSPEDVQKVILETQQRFLRDTFPFTENPTIKQLKDPQFQQLKALLRQKAIEAYKKRAESIHVYAVTDIETSGFPYEIMPWSREAGRAPLDEIWEGQMSLWIQQDITSAIARANGVGNPNRNVMNAPVKRLLSIRVHPGYVGIDTTGALMGRRSGDDRRGGGGVGADEAAEGNVADANAALPDDFSKAPTGRRSNSIYDVRHANLSVVVDYTRLPELFDAIGQVNLMTVLHMELSDEDEFAAFREGYVYGSGDAVRVDMIIETIWLRAWTKNYMPKEVRVRLGIDKAEDAKAG